MILGKQYMQKGEEEMRGHSVCVPGWAVNDVIILKFWGIGVVRQVLIAYKYSLCSSYLY